MEEYPCSFEFVDNNFMKWTQLQFFVSTCYRQIKKNMNIPPHMQALWDFNSLLGRAVGVASVEARNLNKRALEADDLQPRKKICQGEGADLPVNQAIDQVGKEEVDGVTKEEINSNPEADRLVNEDGYIREKAWLADEAADMLVKEVVDVLAEKEAVGVMKVADRVAMEEVNRLADLKEESDRLVRGEDELLVEADRTGWLEKEEELNLYLSDSDETVCSWSPARFS